MTSLLDYSDQGNKKLNTQLNFHSYSFLNLTLCFKIYDFNNDNNNNNNSNNNNNNAVCNTERRVGLPASIFYRTKMPLEISADKNQP